MNSPTTDDEQLDILRALAQTRRPVGLAQLAALAYSDEQSIQEKERHLITLGLVELTSSGRTLTRLGKRYMRKLDG